MNRGALIGIGIVAVVIAAGCGGGDASTSLPTLPRPGVVAACFRHEGVSAVYQKKENGITRVDGLTTGAAAAMAFFTEDTAKTEKVLKTYDESPFEAFEVLEGAAVGVINITAPANKQIVLKCLE